MMYRTRLLFALIHGCLVVLLVSACTATPISDPESLAQATPEVTIAQATPEVTIQGDTPGREEVQAIELDNCTGKADATRIEQRTQSVDVTISTEVAAKIGASVEIVSAEVQAAVGLAITPGSERTTSIQLVAPPDTRMVFELVWVGNEQIGVVQNIRNSDVPVAFRSFLPTDVRIRSQSDIGCSGSSSPQVVFEPTTLPQTSISTTEPFCAFVTQNQVEELKTFQDVASAIRKAEEFAGYRQNDYTEGSTVPAGVLIATDLLSTNLEQFGVIPINNQGGWGLFVTAREIQAPNAGTYWCIQPNASTLSPEVGINCAFFDELLTKVDVIQQLYEGQSLAGVQARLLYSVDVPIGWIVHKDSQEYTGPIHFDANVVASFWSPVSCRPLSINN